MPSLIVIPCPELVEGIATCLGRWRLLASRLSPFLPASNPRLPGARQGKVLSLHHLEGKSFAYMNTQLSRLALSLSKCTMTLPLIPCILRYNFERTGRTHLVLTPVIFT